MSETLSSLLSYRLPQGRCVVPKLEFLRRMDPRRDFGLPELNHRRLVHRVISKFRRLEIGRVTNFLIVPVRYALISQMGQILVSLLFEVVWEGKAFFRAHLVDEKIVGAHVV